MPSFKEFWEQNKHVLQFVGIISGVGALFLAIPLPQDPSAKDALLNLQFMWLVFIGLGGLTLLIQLFSFMNDVEKFAEKKFGLKFWVQGTPTYLVMSLLFLFCANIWTYASAIYTKPLRSFEGMIAYPIAGLALFGTELLLKKFEQQLGKLTRILLQAAAISIIVMLGIELGTTAARNELYLLGQWSWWLTVLALTIAFFSLILLMNAYFEYKKTKTTPDDPIPN